MTRHKGIAAALWTSLGLLALCWGCAGYPHRRPEEILKVTYDTSGTPLAQVVAEKEGEHPGESGFFLLNDGAEAFRARAELIDLSHCTLDCQYFIWDYDYTGQVLLEKALAAARRGVRVRLLLDDFTQPGMDTLWRQIASHPNVEVRLFNPFSSRRAPYLRRWFEFLARLKTLNHRMHNKLLVADGVAAILGGRNIGDMYYGVNMGGYNHRDFDVLCAGPTARELSGDFETYWDSPWTVPIHEIWNIPPTPEDVQAADQERRDAIAGWSPWPYLADEGPWDDDGRLHECLGDLVWAPGRVYADPPSKVRKEDDGVMMGAIQDFAAQVQQEVVIISPYWGLLNKRKERRALQSIQSKGIRIKVLTNSLDSIDGPWSHVGWARARYALVEHGVEVHEMRPDPACRSAHTAFVSEGKEVVLHSKVAVADCRLVFFGTMNLDPRSLSTNTETAVVVESPELARQVLNAVAPDFLPENSWRVRLGSDVPGECGKEAGPGGLVWLTEINGQPVCRPKEPGTGSFKHLARSLLGLFPINRLL